MLSPSGAQIAAKIKKKIFDPASSRRLPFFYFIFYFLPPCSPPESVFDGARPKGSSQTPGHPAGSHIDFRARSPCFLFFLLLIHATRAWAGSVAVAWPAIAIAIAIAAAAEEKVLFAARGDNPPLWLG